MNMVSHEIKIRYSSLASHTQYKGSKKGFISQPSKIDTYPSVPFHTSQLKSTPHSSNSAWRSLVYEYDMAYYSAGNARHSFRDHFVEPPSILNRIIAALPRSVAGLLKRLWERESYRIQTLPRTLRHSYRTFSFRNLVSFPHILVALWVVVLLWGERWAFSSSVNACNWKAWERWVSRHVEWGALLIGAAKRRNTSPPDIYRGSSISRSSYIHGATVASLYTHGASHGQLH